MVVYIKHINIYKQACNYTKKSTMTTSVYQNKINKKLIEDIGLHIVMLRGTQMVNYKYQLFFRNCTVIKNSIVISNKTQIKLLLAVQKNLH